MSKTWRKRLKTLWRRQIPLEVSVANALVGAGESDSDSSGDESDSDEEDDSGAAPGFAPTGDAADDDLGVPAADDAGPDIPDAGLDPAPVPATADAPAPAAAPAPAFTLSPRLVDLQLPRAMKEILQKRQQASQQEINKKRRFEMAASRDAQPRTACNVAIASLHRTTKSTPWYASGKSS